MAPKTVRNIRVTVIAAALLFILIGLAERAQRALAGVARSAASPRRNYVSTICADGWKHEVSYSNAKIDHFTLTLSPGCFSGFVYLPRWWHGAWRYQPTGDLSKWWVNFWFSGTSSPEAGPFGPHDTPNFNYGPVPIRLQGEGTILFFNRANVALPSAENKVDEQAVKPDSPQHEASSPPGTAKQVGGFLYTLKDCRLSADYLLCFVNVTNRDQERNLSIENRLSRIVDSGGHEHHAKKMVFGATHDEDCCWVETVMPPDVPFELQMGFEQVPPDSTEVRLLEFGGNKGIVKFYGVPVAK